MRYGVLLRFVSLATQFILSRLKKLEFERLFNSDIGVKEKFTTAVEYAIVHDFISGLSLVTGPIGRIS
jgi:hypothetical protein